MPIVSAFQCLPPHIAKEISRYYVSTYTKMDGDVESTIEDDLWTTMYYVSYNWRNLALQYFLSEATINISQIHGPEQPRYKKLPADMGISSQDYCFVKKIVLEYVEKKSPIVDDEFFKCITDAWPEDIVFPAARFLVISLGDSLWPTASMIEVDDCNQLCLLLQRIQSSAPNLQKISMGGLEIDLHQNISNIVNRDWSADNALPAFFGCAKAYVVKLTGILSACSFLYHFLDTNLTQVKYNYTKENVAFRWIMQRSAATLESIEYHESHSIKTRSLFMDNENRPIVYPRLKKFHYIYGCEPDDTKKLRVDQAIAPFPVLKHLIWEGFYVFEDDTIFRGNSNTLEYLNIGIDASLFEILKKHRVFGPGTYLNLQHVSLWKLHYNEGVAFAHGEFERFAVSLIGPVTKYFGITAENLSYLTSFMSKSPCRESIQALDLISFMGTLDELLGIVRLLPNLTKLFSSPGTIACEPSTVEFRKFVDGCYKDGCFAKHRLQRWDVGLQYLDDIKFIAPTALALAALCPNFALVCSQYNIEEYKNKVKEAVACGRLNDYIEGTKRLL